MASKIHNMTLGKYKHQKSLYKSNKNAPRYFNKAKAIDLIEELECITRLRQSFLFNLRW